MAIYPPVERFYTRTYLKIDLFSHVSFSPERQNRVKKGPEWFNLNHSGPFIILHHRQQRQQMHEERDVDQARKDGGGDDTGCQINIQFRQH